MFRRALTGSALAALALATAAQAQAQTVAPVAKPATTSVVTPAYGSIDPFYGSIDPFYGSIDPFWGSIDPFYGSIDPFYGSIDPFYGSIDPFYGSIDPFYGSIDPFYGSIDPFWGSIDPFYGSIDPFAGAAPAYRSIGDYWKKFGALWQDASRQWDAIGANPQDPASYQKLQATLKALLAQSEATWGAAVTARTGKSFRAGFADALLAKHGVSLDSIASLKGLTAAQRTRLFLDWFDGLMAFSGRDHLDHWMGTVNWTPSITRVQGGGTGSIIGLLDSTIVNDADIANNIVHSGGYQNALDGHGTSVASLMVAAHDGRGLMGIAPNASIAAYNPFDHTNTASWADVTTGIVALKARGASVINMSLGVAGATLHKDWAPLFADPAVATARGSTVFVLAAGNEGKAQTNHIAWNWATDPNLIVVGSVGPSGAISRFSNTPGNACLLNAGTCSDANRLWNRFIVAPGEAILVSDGKGGLVRRTGTSFAAPLVSGAIALLHDRWPWLSRHPDETVDIILRSARDLGAPGADPVYGRGLLDVKASQSPLNFNNLVFYEYRGGVMIQRSPSTIRTGGVKANWEAEGAFFTMFEPIGDTRRDFTVPLSSRLVGKKVSLNGASPEFFQNYLTSRFIDWIKTGKLAESSANQSFSDVPQATMAPLGDFELGFTLRPSLARADNPYASPAPHSMIRLHDRSRGVALSAGFGQGALAMSGTTGFGLTSDHDSDDGGVNPLLGFASGGAFAAVDFKIAPRTTLSGGMTSTRLVHSRMAGLGEDDRFALRGIDPYRAKAVTLGVTHQLDRRVAVGLQLTRLDERAAVLGVQSLEDGDLKGGSVSTAATLSASADVGKGVQLSVSATAADTRTADDNQAFATADGGVLTSAFAVAAAKTGIVGSRDQLRLSLAQPLHIERGAMAFTSVQVVDRETGDIGPVTQRFDIGGQQRRAIGELLYATPLLGDGGEFSLFGRADLRPGASTKPDRFIVGGRIKLGF